MAQGRLTVTLVAVLVICLAGGGAGAYLLGRHRATVAIVGKQSSAAVAGGSGTPRSARSSSARSAATGTAPVLLTDPPLVTTSGRAAEDTTVVLVGAAANDDPQRSEIRELLQKHFDSINKRDYQGWRATVTEPQVGELPEDAWLQAYASTRDTDISVIAITSKPRQAQLTFRSRQAAAQAPDKTSTCLNWRITVPLVSNPDGSLLIGRSVTDSAGYQACYSG